MNTESLSFLRQLFRPILLVCASFVLYWPLKLFSYVRHVNNVDTAELQQI